jgi:CIC family chloride channel protein
MFRPNLGKIKILLLHHYWHRTGGMLGFAVLLGIAGGATAAAFKYVLTHVESLVLGSFAGFPFIPGEEGILPRYLFFLVPAAGGLLSGMLVYGLAPSAAGAGTDALIDSFHNRGGHVPVRTAVVKFFSSIITLGSGGSAGQEGPMAQIGGGLGSLVGKLFRLPDRLRRILLLTGTAAGLGAIFHAPLGAALTAAEIVYKEDFESQGFMPFTVASVVAFAFYSVLTHQHTSYLHFPQLAFTNLAELFNYALVGLLCVPFSKAFVAAYRYTQSFFLRLKVPRFLKPAIGGLLVGLVAYICPQAVGSNWNYLTDAVSGSFAFSTLLFIACMKILATSWTIGSGGSGGVFGPSLFIGGMVGGALGFGLHALEPGWVANPGSYVLVGMGAFFAGAAKAPLAGLIMVCEITGNYGLLAPLLLASTIHLSLSRKWSLYESQKHDKFSSPAHAHNLKVDVLSQVRIKDIFHGNAPFSVLRSESGGIEALETTGASEQSVYPVIGPEGVFEGLVTSAALRMSVLGSSTGLVLSIADIMSEPYGLEAEMDLHEALISFLESSAVQLPVLGPGGEILGMLSLHELMAEYDRKTQGTARNTS